MWPAHRDCKVMLAGWGWTLSAACYHSGIVTLGLRICMAWTQSTPGHAWPGQEGCRVKMDGCEGCDVSRALPWGGMDT